MDRRTFLSLVSYLSFACLANAKSGAFMASGALSRVSDKDLSAEIDRRMNEKAVDYFSVLLERPEILARMKNESPELFARLEPLLRDPKLVAVLDQWRFKGLERLRTLDADPAARMLLLDLKLDKILHEVATCLDHFVGVFSILRRWGHSESIAYTGLFHAIYGTWFNQLQVLNSNDEIQRSRISRVIGSQSERLVFLYGTMDPVQLIVNTAETGEEPGEIRRYQDCRSDQISRGEFLALSETLVANSLEPAESGADPTALSRLRQFEYLRPYLSTGATAAINQVRENRLPLDELKAGLKCQA